MEQIRYFIDSPDPGHAIRSPSFTLAGWFAVTPARELLSPLLHLRRNTALPLAPQERPDVRRHFADHAVLGFSGTFPSQLLLECEEPYVTVQTNSTAHRIPLLLATEKQYLQRLDLGCRYLHGAGIEIGALQDPLPLPPGTSVQYVDRMTVHELRHHYPELNKMRLIDPDVIDNGETLASFADQSLDFVVANHFLEHCEDTIGALQNMLRVLRPGGILFLAVPDKRFTFETERPTTTLEHIIADHRQGPARSRELHYQEWVDVFKKECPPQEKDKEKKRLMALRYSINFTTWTTASCADFVAFMQHEYPYPFELENLLHSQGETILVMRRTT